MHILRFAIAFFFLLVATCQIKAEEIRGPRIDQNITRIEQSRNASTLKIIDELLQDNQILIQPACFILIDELKNYEGHISDPFQFFVNLLSHKNWMIQGCAVRGLGKILDPRAISIIMDLIKNNKDSFLIESSVLALGDLRAESSIGVISGLLNDNAFERNVHEAAIKSLFKIKAEKAINYLIPFLAQPTDSEKMLSSKLMAIWFIGKNKSNSGIFQLIKILNDCQEQTICRIAAAEELMNMKEQNAKQAMNIFFNESKEIELIEKIRKLKRLE